jgi:hypothetical protein
MIWKFDCFICGYRWQEEHRKIGKEDFVNSVKKEGRPMLMCPRCQLDKVQAPIVGYLKH